MKKQTLINALIAIGGIIIAYALITQLHILSIYSISSACSTPNLLPGEVVFSSNLKTPKRFDFVAFRLPDSSAQFVNRVCGLPGDTITIFNSKLYVDEYVPDNKDFLVKHCYVIEKRLLYSISDIDNRYHSFPVGNDSVFISLTKKEHEIVGEPELIMPDMPIKAMQETFGEPWGLINFGPYVVPKDSVFVLGDNRENSIDSRFFGCVAKKDIVGTLLFK